MKILWKRFLPQQLCDSWRQAGSVFALCPTPDKLHILLWKLLFGTIKVINEVFRYYDVQRSEIRVCALQVSCPKLVLCSLLVKVVKAIVSSNYPIPRTKIFAEILLISNKIRVDCRQIKEENKVFSGKEETMSILFCVCRWYESINLDLELRPITPKPQYLGEISSRRLG